MLTVANNYLLVGAAFGHHVTAAAFRDRAARNVVRSSQRGMRSAHAAVASLYGNDGGHHQFGSLDWLHSRVPVMIRRPMPPAVRVAFTAELAASRNASTSEARWHALERAHILSQPWAWPHTKAHAVMLAVAWREHNRGEAVGQIIRLLVAAPGSALGKYPEGNNGRAAVPLTQTMPVPADLAALLSTGFPSKARP